MLAVSKIKSWTGAPGMSVVSNSVITALKLIIGTYTGSVSVMAEALHSGMDLVASVMALFSFRIGRKPADSDHNFGHGKIEGLSGAVEAALIFVAAGLIVYEAGNRLLHGSVLQNLELGIAVMGLSVVVNLVIGYYTLRFSKVQDSLAMEANAWHLLTDVITSLGVFAGLIVVRITGWEIVDPILAIGVALWITRTAYQLTAKSVRHLLDAALPPDELDQLNRVLTRHGHRFIEYHRIRSRKVGAYRHVDLHLVVDGRLSVEEAHCLCDHLEMEVRETLPRTYLVIHLEPPDHHESDNLAAG